VEGRACETHAGIAAAMGAISVLEWALLHSGHEIFVTKAL